MKINVPITAAVAAAAAAAGLALMPTAGADTTLGQQGRLTNGDVVQAWTISDLKVSTDQLPYQPKGTLWEATATDEAIQGSVIPIVANFNAKANDGETYRVLYGVASAQGVNPGTLSQGEKTTGKIYFDVTGANPETVTYTSGDEDLLTWKAAPAAAPAQRSGGSTQSHGSTPAPAVPVPEGAAPQTGTPPVAAVPGVPAVPASDSVPHGQRAAGSQGTPVSTEG